MMKRGLDRAKIIVDVEGLIYKTKRGTLLIDRGYDNKKDFANILIDLKGGMPSKEIVESSQSDFDEAGGLLCSFLAGYKNSYRLQILAILAVLNYNPTMKELAKCIGVAYRPFRRVLKSLISEGNIKFNLIKINKEVYPYEVILNCNVEFYSKSQRERLENWDEYKKEFTKEVEIIERSEKEFKLAIKKKISLIKNKILS